MKKNIITILFFSIFTFNFSANADVKVVASIKPIHSLASYVMDGVGKPDVIVDGYNSPHGFSMKPSHAKMIENADLIIWVGEDLETFLEKPLDTIAKKAKIVEVMDTKGIQKLKFREKNIFEEHDDHGHKKDKHDDHEGHHHGEHDPHVWLDPVNAKAIVKEIASQLVQIDSKNSSTYKANSKKAIAEIDQLIKDIKKDINKKSRFVVFHDAYQYFENRFGITVLGGLTVNTEFYLVQNNYLK